MKFSIVFSIDPGFAGTGLCMFVNKELYKFTNIKTKASDTERYVDIASRCANYALQWLHDLINTTGYDDIYIVSIVIESPHAMGGVSGRASLLRGDVFKVAKLAGAIGAVMYLYIDNFTSTNIHIYYPEVRTWKGQVSKATTQRRVLRDIVYSGFVKGKNKLSEDLPEHIYDAAGIGLWFINKTIMGDM